MLRRFCLLSLSLCLLYLTGMAQRTEPVSVNVVGGVVHGTLTMPAGKTKPPVALIIPNTGSLDRNGNSGQMVNNSLKLLSDSLAKHGIASVRFDKRGIGESQAVTTESKIVFTDYVSDAGAWLQWMRRQKRFGKLFLIGHGEGALVAILAAQNEKVDGLISISGAGQSADTIMLHQLELQQLRPGPMDTTKMLLAELRRNGTVASVPPGDFYQTLFRPTLQRYVLSWITPQPAIEISKLRCPILLIQGGRDLHIDSTQVDYLRSAAPGAQVLKIPELNQVLRKAPADFAENFTMAYEPYHPLHAALVNGIVRFIKTGK